jgi:acetyltransferase-like isoleucine patch superfamily enzyme
MDSRADITLTSGVRLYARPTWRQRLRVARMKRQLAAVGAGAYVEENVKFLRHPERIRLGDHTLIKEGARICPTNPDAAISIGDWTTIGYHTFLFASAAITIGANCLIAPFCYLVDSNHGIAGDRLIREQAMTARPIAIADDVWLGVRVTVLKGVHIGRGAVVGAGAVVNEDVPELAIVAGNPARVIGYRT